MRSLENIKKEFVYWKEVRDFVVSAPMSDLGGTVIAQRISKLVIDKMHSLESEARNNKYIHSYADKKEHFDWTGGVAVRVGSCESCSYDYTNDHLRAAGKSGAATCPKCGKPSYNWD